MANKASNNKPTPSPLGSKLAKLIKLSGYDHIRDFERAAGVRHDSIRRVIGGYQKTLSMEDLKKVSKVLDVSIQELLESQTKGFVTTAALVPEAKNPCWCQILTDEMLPTLSNGENVLVDTGVTSFSGAGIYKIGTEEYSVYRRISLTYQGKLRIEADNKAYNYCEEAEPQDVNIQGRVIGSFHRI